MASPKKTLLVEQISYAEEALRRLKAQLHQLFEDIEREYQRVFNELKNLEENETKIDEETFDRVNKIIQQAWTEAMSSRTRLQDLDNDLHKLDGIMSSSLEKLRSNRDRYT
jgi:DNA repair exonuclease SbcCD ATPase subunit